MEVHLVDGTYELFRHFYAVPGHADSTGREVGAIRGVLRSLGALIRDGATHLAVATDHVVESFRNDLYDGYKTGEGIDPELEQQFHPLEDALRAMGVVVWPMIEHEADDGLASGARRAAEAEGVDRVLICSPDKDLAQCVRGRKVVQFDRRQRILRDEDGVWNKFGVGPASIPDYLALVGDAADGIPGLPRWGARSTSALLARYGHLDRIPEDESRWEVTVRGAAALSASLRAGREDAMLFRDLATLRADVPVLHRVEELRWRGPTADFAEVCRSLDLDSLVGLSPAGAL